VEEMAETLKVNGIKALPYHAGMDSATRTQNQDKFLMEEIDVIVATIAFGMGIDKPMSDLSFIMIFQKVWKDIIRKPEGQEETEVRGAASLFTVTRIFRNLKNSCRGNPSLSRKLENNCSWKQFLTLNLQYAGLFSC